MPSSSRPVAPLDAQRLQAFIDQLTLHERRPREAGAFEVPVVGHVLVGIASDPATRWAVEWAEALGTVFAPRVTLLHAAAPLSASYTVFGGPAVATVDELQEADEREGRELVQTAAHALREAGLDVSMRHASGSPVREIVKAARDEDADLIVLGCPTRGALDRLLLGNVADGVKNHADAHVLLAKGLPVPGDILCPVDGSWMSKRAATLAHVLARSWGSRLRILHVLEPPPHADAAAADATARALEAQLTNAAAGLEDVEFRLRAGHPVDTVVQEAEAMEAKLVVLGNRGLGGLRSLVAGSITNALTHRLPQSLLLVKGARGAAGTVEL